MKSKNNYFAGLYDGLPICLGYISVAFAFGVFAISSGCTVLESVLISMTNVTSAGQLSGVAIISGGGTLIELALTQFIINIRYSLMSISISQKFDGSIRMIDRFFLAFVNTDEVFAVGHSKYGKLSRNYMYGLITMPYLGWTLGTAAGALAGDIFPQSVTSALGIAIYGMFFAVFVPASKKDRPTALCVLFAVALSCAFRFIPVLSAVSGGFVIIICSVASSALFAFIDVRRKKVQNNES